MCGIIGVVGVPAVEDWAVGDWPARRDMMAHRGPDGFGEWADAAVPVWLGHRRLAVQDTSDAAAQPMVSASGNWVVSYNGEIYNAPDLRRELQAGGATFRGHGDTEVLLAAIERWGIEGALARFDGMFAFALWDCADSTLWLARDRMGIKPLVYAPAPGGGLAFASILAPLKTLPWFDRTVDPAALAAYFRWLNVPTPLCVFRGARKLPPGGLLRWRNGAWSERLWWRLEDVCAPSRRREGLSMNEAADELETLLADAVRRQMLSDVKLGVFLSGGIDSSVVAAMMARAGTETVRSFAIGFHESSHDESGHAEKVAAHLGLDHSTIKFTATDMLDILPTVMASHDEPFADVGSLPMRLLCGAARRDVTVALAGDGGDELFGGYPRYFWAGRIGQARRRLGPLGPPAAGLLAMVPPGLWDGPVNRLTGGRFGGSEGLSHRISRLARYLVTPEHRVYEALVAAWPNPPLAEAIPGAAGPNPARFGTLPWPERMMAADQASYLPDEVLTKVDYTSMAVSLEVRVPLLDHRVVEWAWTLPMNLKWAGHGDRGKLVLREVLRRHVPDHLVERPKMGFGVPLTTWLRGPLKDWAADLIHGADDGLLDGKAVKGAWRGFLAGQGGALPVWTALAYLDWRARSV